MSKYKILDFYVHQGAQRELFKTGHDFYLVGANGEVPHWNVEHRPLGSNVRLISEKQAEVMDFDIVIIRTPISYSRYKKFLNRNNAGIAAIQTVDPIWLPKEVEHIVWNSRQAMKNKLSFYRNRHQHFIPHGYDPEEFRPLGIEKNNRVLTIANHFKKRELIMGYSLWNSVRGKINVCDVVGSKNEDVPGAIEHLQSMDDLIECYNRYSVYFNPTIQSVMPRTRAEAAMCGMPIVSTTNYDFANFFTEKEAIFANTANEAIYGINKLLKSKAMQKEYGEKARQIAIKHFHIDDYLSRWNAIFKRASQ